MRGASTSPTGLVLALVVGLSLGLASRICPAGPASQPGGAPADARAVAELLDQLGHRDFQRREAATKRLIEIGEASRPLLEATATQPDLDPEVADRIKTVLKGIGRRTLKISDTVSMELVRIPAGKFLMGSPDDERETAKRDLKAQLDMDYDFKEEAPQHEVTISKPFYMGMYEVTQEQYEQIMGKNPSYFSGAQKPVEHVSWDNAVADRKSVV
jgi:formylglycine-generating enzyme required for sulfatase activity